MRSSPTKTLNIKQQAETKALCWNHIVSPLEEPKQNHTNTLIRICQQQALLLQAVILDTHQTHHM